MARPTSLQRRSGALDANAISKRLRGYPHHSVEESPRFEHCVHYVFTSVLLDAKVLISMDGKGAWRDNVFVERLWRSVKYEEVYLRAYESVSEARASISR